MNSEDKKNSNNDVQETADLEERIVELENNWKRALADYKNLEKRVEEEKQAIVSFSNIVLIARLIPILDNLELLENHINDTGLKLTVKQLKELLEEEGVKEIEALGSNFDHEEMEAVEMVEGTPGKVVEVELKGYKLKDKLIRPARVKVGKQKEE
jgi:molecular chaperone GrpE